LAAEYGLLRFFHNGKSPVNMLKLEVKPEFCKIQVEIACGLHRIKQEAALEKES
jgi:hypothetical protein